MWSPLRDRSVVSPLETWNVPVEQSIGVSFVCESAIADKDPPFRRPGFVTISPAPWVKSVGSRVSRGEKSPRNLSRIRYVTARTNRSIADFKERLDEWLDKKTPAAFTFGSNPIDIVPPDVSDGRDLFVLRCVGQIYNLVNLTPSSTF